MFSRLRVLASRVRGFFAGRRLDEDFQSELAAHLDMLTEENIRRGLPPDEARRQAHLRLGGAAQLRETQHDLRGLPWLETLLQDVHFGLRMLRKNPGFTAVAVLTLALGIGANTAIFSVIDGMLLNPVPFREPDRIVSVHSRMPLFPHLGVSYPNFLDWQRESHSFEQMAAWRMDDFGLTGSGEPEMLKGEMVSTNFFSLLGVRPILGRTFRPEEDHLGAAPVTLISEGLWKRRFGSNPDTIGKGLTLNGKDYTIVGVIPSRFPLMRFSDVFAQDRSFDDVFVPVGQWDYKPFQDRQDYIGLEAIARLNPGVALPQARADLDQVAQQLAAAYPKDDSGVSVNIIPLKEDVTGDVQPSLLMLWGAVGFMLLIACANVANLLLARSAGRTQEFAIRTALGASRGRLARQLLVESAVLATIGGVLGVVMAGSCVQPILSLFPSTLPGTVRVEINSVVLVFAVAASVLTGILFGLVPALTTSKANLQGALKEGGRGIAGSRSRTQSVFVVAETGLALVLLAGAGLLIRSFISVSAVDPGFDPRNVLTLSTAFSPAKTSDPRKLRVALRELTDRLTTTPGVESASLAMGTLPLAGDSVLGFWPHGKPQPRNPQDLYRAQDYLVGPDYFRALRIPLIRGRVFTQRDDNSAPTVVIVDETLANNIFPGQDPLGKRLDIGPISQPAEIVGVVGHVKQWGLDGEPKVRVHYELYLPCMQIPDAFLPQAAHSTSVILRSGISPVSLVRSIREVIHALDNDQVIYNARTMDDTIADSLAARRFSVILLGLFAGIALLLATIGIYGVVSYLVGQRTHEIGIRIALGAQRRDILRIVLRQGGKMALLGIVLGLAASLGLTRFIASMLFGVSATDPVTFASVVVILLGVAVLACYVPARRAMRVDPMVALRHE